MVAQREREREGGEGIGDLVLMDVEAAELIALRTAADGERVADESFQHCPRHFSLRRFDKQETLRSAERTAEAAEGEDAF